METVSDLGELLKGMRPNLREGRYFISSVEESQLMAIVSVLDQVVDIFREDEGFSVVFSENALEEMRGISGSRAAGPFAWISLDVYSDLMAVGFLARITEALAAEKISVNAFSAFHHDHIFVPYEKRERAMDVLAGLTS
jgi:hypothetical protein